MSEVPVSLCGFRKQTSALHGCRKTHPLMQTQNACSFFAAAIQMGLEPSQQEETTVVFCHSHSASPSPYTIFVFPFPCGCRHFLKQYIYGRETFRIHKRKKKGKKVVAVWFLIGIIGSMKNINATFPFHK